MAGMLTDTTGLGTRLRAQTPDEQRQHARRVVASCAYGARDCRDLLAALGLLDDESTVDTVEHPQE